AAALGPPGNYTMFWQAVSADGHIVSDDFTFTWRPGAGAPISTGSKIVPNCHGTLSGIPRNAQATPKTPTAPWTNGGTTALLWIGGGVLAIGAAAVGTLLILSRPKKKPVE
ncbi:MAG: copper resistance protein CopC, partial [Microbacteriaceae bacterium]